MSDPSPRKKDRTVGLLIVGVAFLSALCISWWAREASNPQASPEPAPPTTAGVTGFPAAVDVTAALDAAREVTVREELLGYAANGVKSDGTIDLGAPGASVRFAFQSNRGEGPQPPRDPGTLPFRSYCGRQNVHLRKDGLAADADQPTAMCSARHEPLPAPRCGPKEVWQQALSRGAPADRTARIEYYRSKAGPAFRFEIPGVHTFSVYGDCETMLTAVEQPGTVP